MKITILTDNVAGAGFLAEHGLSYLVEHQGSCVLLDTGSTDVYRHNARLLGIDLEQQADCLVLSHGHWDHGNGLRYISDKKLVLHPDAFVKRFHPGEDRNLGLVLTRHELEERFELLVTADPFFISDSIVFLGSIPRLNAFESQTTAFVNADSQPDFVPDDSALVCIEDHGIHVVGGCSHSGICNTIERAIQVTGQRRVLSVTGGLHLQKENQQTHETIRYLKELGVTQVYPSHCTELPAMAAFYRAFGGRQLKTGMRLQLDHVK